MPGSFPVAFATAAEVKTGTASDKAVAPAALLSAIGFSAYFQSAQQVITAAGSLTLGHGLSRTPVLVLPYLVCQTAEHGYAIGDVVAANPHFTGYNASYGLSIVPDATNINVRYGSPAATFRMISKDLGALVDFTNANWKLIVRAFA